MILSEENVREDSNCDDAVGDVLFPAGNGVLLLQYAYYTAQGGNGLLVWRIY